MSTREDTSPELERLRAAHDRIPDPDPLLLSAMREQVLEAAARGDRRHRRRRARRPLAFAVAACVLAGVTAVSIDFSSRQGGRGGLPQIGAIEQARAALAAPGAIVHYTVTLSTEERNPDPRFADCNAGPLEVWRATDPTRWRAVQPVSDDPNCGTMDLSQGLGPVVAPRLEVSYADGRTTSYVPGRDIMLVIDDGDAPADGERRAPSSAAGAASIQLFSTPPVRKPGRDGEPFADAGAPDPISDVERLLADGELRDQGATVRDGRRVRVLTGGWTRGEGENVVQTTTVEYVVDAETFAPIAATTTTRMSDSGATASTRAAFGDYERIALTGDSAELLEIHPERTPRIVERTIEQIKNPLG